MNVFLVTVVLLACFTLRSHAQGATVQHKNFTSLTESVQDAEQYILSLKNTYNIPSIVFGLSVKGKIVMQKSWGFADLSNEVAATEHFHYPLGSVSKTYTSAIVGNLVASGLLHYDDPISKYLPEHVFPTKHWESSPVNITVRMLLSHTAGTHVSDIPRDLEAVTIAENVTQTIAQFKSEPLLFKPGSKFSYSNYGFQLLGAVIEAVTKRRFQDIAADFFAKNGLTSTFVGNNSMLPILKHVPRFYTAVDEKNPRANIPTLPYDELVFLEGNWPAGGIISTIGDQLKYGQRLIDAHKGRPNAIVPQNILKEMWSPQAPPMEISYFINSRYCLGWRKAFTNSKLRYPNFMWHTGVVVGTSSMLAVYPEQEVVAALLTNKGSFREMDKLVVYVVENVLPMAG